MRNFEKILIGPEKLIGQRLKKPENAELLLFLHEHFPHAKSITEAFWCHLNTFDPICEISNRKKRFISWSKGFSNSCGKGKICECNMQRQSILRSERNKDPVLREKISEGTRARFEKMSEAEKDELRKAQSAGHSEESIIQRSKTYEKRTGFKNPSNNPVVVKKRKQTNQKKYGVDFPSQNDDILEKMLHTNRKNHDGILGFNTEKARLAHKKAMNEKYGVDFALQNEDIRKSTRDSLEESTGVRYPFQSKEILIKAKKAIFKKYGVESYFQSEEFKEFLKENEVRSANELVIEKKTRLILRDKDLFNNFLLKKTLGEAALDLNIHHETVRRYAIDYDSQYMPGFRSVPEILISRFLEENQIQALFNKRNIIPPLEIDIFMPEYNLAIEFCGLYWHSDARIQAKDYHRKKYDLCKNKGIRLLTIFEDEFTKNPDIVFGIIGNFLRLSTETIGARKTILNEIPFETVRNFLNNYHIQGSSPFGGTNIGAYLNNELIGVMIFGKSIRQNGAKCELKRFCTDGRNFPGLADKMFKFFIRSHCPEQIVSYSDNRWFSGEMYEKLGFKLQSESDFGHYYVSPNFLDRFHPMRFSKKEIKKKFGIDEGTEKEMMVKLGYHRIYDCGKKKWLWKQ